jgi:flagellar biosynthetic protein FliR
MVLSAPVLGSRQIPLMIRVAGSLMISLVALPLTKMPSDAPDHWGGLLSAMLSEVVIGTMMGLGVLIIYSAAESAGTLIGQMAGLQVDTFSGAQTSGQSTMGRMFAILSAAIFVLIGGPEMLIASVLGSFQALPLGAPIDTQNLLELCVTLLHQSFVLSLRAVAPAMGAILIATVVIGMVSRSLPQVNILQVGLSSNLIVMLLAIFLTLGGCIWLFVDDIQSSIELLKNALQNSA